MRAQDDGAAVTGPPSKIMVIRIITLDGDLRGFRYSRGYRFRPSSVENFHKFGSVLRVLPPNAERQLPSEFGRGRMGCATGIYRDNQGVIRGCLLYTSPSPRDRQKSRMPSSA